jgi:hypothetical protein
LAVPLVFVSNRADDARPTGLYIIIG